MLAEVHRRPALTPLTWLAAGAGVGLLTTAMLLAAPRVDAAETVTVDISDFAFQPATVTIQAGDTVTWTNNDSVAHTATSTHDPASFDGEMEPGESFSFTFSEPGTFDYICEIHPAMEGTIVVEAAAASPGASQLPDGAIASEAGDDIPPAAVLGMALIALSLLVLPVAALRRARQEA
jgi:plastocyanin